MLLALDKVFLYDKEQEDKEPKQGDEKKRQIPHGSHKIL